jgi:hypothetical protein
MMLFLSADTLTISEHFMTVARLSIPKHGKNHSEKKKAETTCKFYFDISL